MAVRTEVCARLANTPGTLAAAFEALSQARITIEAWHLGSDACLRLMCDNPLLAADVLAGVVTRSGDERNVTARDVLTTTIVSRDLGRLLRRCARSGINIEYVYSGQGDGHGSTLVVLGVTDPARTSSHLGI